MLNSTKGLVREVEGETDRERQSVSHGFFLLLYEIDSAGHSLLALRPCRAETGALLQNSRCKDVSLLLSGEATASLYGSSWAGTVLGEAFRSPWYFSSAIAATVVLCAQHRHVWDRAASCPRPPRPCVAPSGFSSGAGSPQHVPFPFFTFRFRRASNDREKSPTSLSPAGCTGSCDIPVTSGGSGGAWAHR